MFSVQTWKYDGEKKFEVLFIYIIHKTCKFIKKERRDCNSGRRLRILVLHDTGAIGAILLLLITGIINIYLSGATLAGWPT